MCDSDGKKRYGVNAYSFWCISEMIQRNPLMKKDILKAYNILDSKYGIETFEPYFPADMKGVGRIVDLTPGTYENSCAYIHATMFAVMALFKIGEPKRAWEQIKKLFLSVIIRSAKRLLLCLILIVITRNTAWMVNQPEIGIPEVVRC